MNESSRERVRQFLLNRWARRGHSSGLLEFLFDWLFGSPPKATYVFEHSDCNLERNHCAGKIQRTWLVDDDGIREVAISPESVSNERRGMWYRFRRVHFYIAPDGDWLVETSMDGPRAGHGGCYRVVRTEKTIALVTEGVRWRS